MISEFRFMLKGRRTLNIIHWARDLRLRDHAMFFRNFRMSAATSEKLLSYTGTDLQKTVIKFMGLLVLLSDILLYVASPHVMNPSTIGWMINEACKSM